MSEDKKNGKANKGFAGLTSLLSDVETIGKNRQTPEPAPEAPSPATPTAPPSAAMSQSPARASSSPGPGREGAYQSPTHTGGGGSGGKWIIGLVVAGLVIWGLTQMADQGPTTSEAVYSPPATTTSPTTSSQPSYTPSAPSPAPRLLEEMPGAGSGNVLSASQIRYCLAEEIRLAAAKQVVSEYNSNDVDRFNSMVAEYNSRCSNFRYRRGALESARSEVEKFRTDLLAQGSSRFASVSAAPRVTAPTKPAAVQPSPEARATAPVNAAIQLSRPEEESVEAACSSDKYLNGPAAYRGCRERQLAELRNGLRRPDLRKLASAERESIEAACSSDKYLNGPAAYNRCLTEQLTALGSSNRRPSLNALSGSERESIEAACSSDKYLNGPAAYNQCLSGQLAMLERQPRRPNLSRLSGSERESVEAACSSDKYLNGPAAYNNCLAQQLQQLRK